MIRLSCIAVLLCLCASQAAARTILFIGNSFTFGEYSAVKHYQMETVRDLNPPDARGRTIGGVPALFKAFTVEAGLENYDVSLETMPGMGFDFHLAEKRALIDRPRDVVVGHGHSTLNRAQPGNPALLVSTTKQMSDLLSARNPQVKFYLVATWSRADMTYSASSPWYGKSIYQMGKDVQAGYELAAKGAPGVAGVVPVGLAWNAAIETGLADDNPYDDTGASKMNLWAQLSRQFFWVLSRGADGFWAGDGPRPNVTRRYGPCGGRSRLFTTSGAGIAKACPRHTGGTRCCLRRREVIPHIEPQLYWAVAARQVGAGLKQEAAKFRDCAVQRSMACRA